MVLSMIFKKSRVHDLCRKNGPSLNKVINKIRVIIFRVWFKAYLSSIFRHTQFIHNINHFCRFLFFSLPLMADKFIQGKFLLNLNFFYVLIIFVDKKSQNRDIKHQCCFLFTNYNLVVLIHKTGQNIFQTRIHFCTWLFEQNMSFSYSTTQIIKWLHNKLTLLSFGW